MVDFTAKTEQAEPSNPTHVQAKHCSQQKNPPPANYNSPFGSKTKILPGSSKVFLKPNFNGRVDFIRECPPEISASILQYLDLGDLLRAQSVCKTWYNRANDDVIWRKFWNDAFPEKDYHLRKDFCWLEIEPCPSKLKFLNHMRVMRNWRLNDYRKFQLEDGLVASIAYDGRTLVTNHSSRVGVYRVERREGLRLFQTLNIKSFRPFVSTTNTKVIATKYKSFVAIYALGKMQRYRLWYLLSCDGPELCEAAPGAEGRRHIERTERTCPYGYWSYWIALIGSTMFVFSPNNNAMFGWQLDKRRLELNFRERIIDFQHDLERAFVATPEAVFCFDNEAKLVFKMRPTNEAQVTKTMINSNLVLVMCHANDGLEMSCWNKNTGKLLVDRRKTQTSIHAILHPISNVLYDTLDTDEDSKLVTAVNVLDDRRLWATTIGESSILGDLRCVAANRFLLFSAYSGGQSVDIIDTLTGSYLYSWYGILEDETLFTSYDLFIYYDPQTDKLIVHVYS